MEIEIRKLEVLFSELMGLNIIICSPLKEKMIKWINKYGYGKVYRSSIMSTEFYYKHNDLKSMKRVAKYIPVLCEIIGNRDISNHYVNSLVRIATEKFGIKYSKKFESELLKIFDEPKEADNYYGVVNKNVKWWYEFVKEEIFNKCKSKDELLYELREGLGILV